MAKRLITLFAACLLALSVGCGSSGGDKTPIIPAPAGPLSLSDTWLIVDYFDDGGGFSIENIGSETFSWTASSNQTWLAVSAASGDLGAGQQASIDVTVTRDGLATGTHAARVTVNTDAASNGTVDVTVRNYDEDIDIVEFRVLDAEYDDASDSWVVISRNPSQLHVVDAAEKSYETLSLSIEPQCVSVRPDGAYAVVGHNAWLTRIDLATLTAETPVAVATNANDVVLSSNDYAYIFPKGSSDNVRTVQLPAGTVTQGQQSIYPGMEARLHPIRDEIYGADNGLTPSEVEKFDISSGPAAYLYDSKYHGDHPFNGNLWFANDGSKFLSRGGNVFLSSAVEVEDIDYAGSITGINLVEWANQHPVTNKWFVCHSNWINDYYSEIRIYDGAFFQYESSLNVPDIPDVVGPYETRWVTLGVRYLAVSSDGSQLHVIAYRADTVEWFFASFDLQ